jgi:hypothetical protein
MPGRHLEKIDPAVFAPVPHNRHYSTEWGVAAEEQARATRERHERELRKQPVRPGVVIGGRARRLTFCRSLRVVGGFPA